MRTKCVRAVAPDYASNDASIGEYGFWFVGHDDWEKLNDSVLHELYLKHMKEFSKEEMIDKLDYFMHILEHEEGYSVFQTMHEGWVELPVEECEGMVNP